MLLKLVNSNSLLIVGAFSKPLNNIHACIDQFLNKVLKYNDNYKIRKQTFCNVMQYAAHDSAFAFLLLVLLFIIIPSFILLYMFWNLTPTK